MFTILIILGCLLFINFLLFTFSVSDAGKAKKKAARLAKKQNKEKGYPKKVFGQLS